MNLFRSFGDFSTALRRADQRTRRKVGGLLGLAALIVIGSIWSIISILNVQGGGAKTAELPVEDYMEPPRRELASFTETVELPDVGIQLMTASGEDTASAQFTLVLDCPTKESHAIVTGGQARVLDSVFDVANNAVLEDFKGPGGIERFKEQLAMRLSTQFGKNAPRRIDVKDWVIQ